jgi:peptide/nickel transport system permease protein
MVAIAIVGFPIYARLARGVVLSLREREFVEAARALGSTDR